MKLRSKCKLQRLKDEWRQSFGEVYFTWYMFKLKDIGMVKSKKLPTNIFEYKSFLAGLINKLDDQIDEIKQEMLYLVSCFHSEYQIAAFNPKMLRHAQFYHNEFSNNN